MSRSLWWGVAAASVLVSACSPTQRTARALPPWCTSSSRSAHFMLAPPASTPLSLTEVWRRGGLNKDQVLARPGPPTVGPGGWIAIPDYQLGTVTVLDTAGRWIGPVTKKGHGPGETMMPLTTAWGPDGTLSILDASNFAIIRLEPPDFHFVKQVKAPPTLLSEAVSAGAIPAYFLGARGRVGLELPLPYDRPKGESTLRSIFAVQAPGADVDTLLSIPTAALSAAMFRTWPAPGWATPMAASGPGGAIAVAGDVPQYRVRVLDSKLRDSLVICRDVAPEPLTRAERGDTSGAQWVNNIAAALKDAQRPKTLAAMGRIFFGTEGQIWVQRARRDPFSPQGPPQGTSYDVYAPGGTYVGTVTAPPHVMLYGQIGTLVIGYEEGSLDEISVVAYRLGAASG